MDRRLRVLLSTEGTYPFVMGGVSTWCAQLVEHLDDVEWGVFPVTAGGERRILRFPVPERVEVLDGVRVWSDRPAWRHRSGLVRLPDELLDRPARLAEALLGWDGDPLLATDVLAGFRTRPESLAVFAHPAAWRRFRAVVSELVAREPARAGGPVALDRWTVVELFRSLGWVAVTAATPVPSVDVHLVTAAGWAALPAVVDRHLVGTPAVLAEHGVYVREAYLAAARDGGHPGSRWAATRLARGLARLAYSSVDRVAPVTSAHLAWERAFGVPEERLSAIPNGIAVGDHLPPPAPQAGRVVSVGRIDPLKDIHTLLDVAAEVVRRVPEARFVHHGPISPGSEAYARACFGHHERLGLGGSFRFLGSTTAPLAAVRDADVVVSTSISEGLPIALLEAMAQARPVVATTVGGVAEAVAGCGMVAPPGDAHRLADGVTCLLTRPALAATLGRRARRRVAERFSQEAFLDRYRSLLHECAEDAA